MDGDTDDRAEAYAMLNRALSAWREDAWANKCENGPSEQFVVELWWNDGTRELDGRAKNYPRSWHGRHGRPIQVHVAP